MAGGGTTYVLNPGQPDEIVFDHKIDALNYKAGDRLLAITPGGGGWGDPLQRDMEKVAEDVALGLVSREFARRDYGVVCDEDGILDVEATLAHRAETAAGRGRQPLFDRGKRFG